MPYAMEILKGSIYRPGVLRIFCNLTVRSSFLLGLTLAALIDAYSYNFENLQLPACFLFFSIDDILSFNMNATHLFDSLNFDYGFILILRQFFFYLILGIEKENLQLVSGTLLLEIDCSSLNHSLHFIQLSTIYCPYYVLLIACQIWVCAISFALIVKNK